MAATIFQRAGTLGLLLFFVGSGILLYTLLSGASYLYFFVLRRERYHPEFRPDREKITRSLKWAAYSLIGNSVLMLPLQLLVIGGHSRLYYQVRDHGLLYLGLSIVLLLVVTETVIYWIHRWLHDVPWLFRHLHVHHHKFHVPTPWASVAFHPLDSFAQALPYHLCVFFFPVHELVYLVSVGLVTSWAVSIHDHVAFVSPRFVNNSGCHSAHHWFNRFNYGQYFTFWDRLCGTYKHPNALPASFFAAKGLASDMGLPQSESTRAPTPASKTASPMGSDDGLVQAEIGLRR